jgi:replicative DNA helicase
VVAATDVMQDRPCYRVTFSDGTTVVADAEHQWLTQTRAARRSSSGEAQVRTTAQLAVTARCDTADGRANHSVRNAAPLQLPEADLPVPPYALGAWLGDGHSAGARITTADPEIIVHLEAEGIVVRPQRGIGTAVGPTCPRLRRALLRSGPLPGLPPEHGTLQGLLRGLGVLGDKHIPTRYLRSSEQQRRALLAGLMDTDGTVTVTGNLQFAVTSAKLARDVQELVVSLGHRCSVTTKRVPGRSEASSTCYTLNWTTDERVFRLHRKHQAHKERTRTTPTRTGQRWITAVTPVPSVPVRCVEVDNPDHLYLASRAMIPTHNSTLGLDIARAASVKHAMPSAIFSLEMSKTEITMRLLSAEARVPLHHMRSGTMTDDDWARWPGGWARSPRRRSTSTTPRTSP